MRCLLPIFLAFAGCAPIDPCQSPSAALEAANGFVLENLKAPATASFPSVSDKGVLSMRSDDKKGRCSYYVSSYVDSENSFGAKIREEFTASVYLTEAGEWELERPVFFFSDLK